MADSMDLQINITGTNDTGPSFTAMDSAITAVQDALDSLSKTSQSASEALSRMGQVGGDAARSVESSMLGAEQALRSTGDSASGLGSSVDQLGQALGAEMIGEQLKNIGETGLKVFEEASSAAADFEYNISRIGAVLTTSGKASNAQMQQMSQDALKIGSTSSFSANQVAEGMYTLARQGLDASTILGNGINGAINIVNDLAQATDSDMTDTATVITDVVHEYGLSGAALRDVANTMSGALHNSSESLDDFYQSMKQVGPVASAMHQNALDVSTALALLAQHGITGSSAGTALKNMLLGLSPRTKAAAADFKTLGISVKNGASNSFFDLHGNLKPLPDIINLLNEKFNGLSDAQKQAALSTVFTKYGLAGLNTIVGESRDKFVAFQNELKKDDAATIAAKKMDNLHGDLLKFNAGVQTMMKSFGDSINGMLRPIVQGLSQAVQWITQLPKLAKEAGMILLGLGSAFAFVGGTAITGIGALGMFIPTLQMAGVSTEFLEGIVATLASTITTVVLPILGVVAAVAAVGLAFKLAYDRIKPFHDMVNKVGDTAKQLGTALKGIWSGGAAAGKGISILDNLGFSPAAITAVQNVFASIKDGVAAAKQGFNNVKSAVQGIFMILTGTGDGEGVGILQKLGFSKKTIFDLMKMGGQFKATFDGIKTAVTNAINGVKNIVQPVLTNLLSFWNTHQYQFRQTVETVWNAIGSFLRTAVSFLVSTIGSAVTTIFDWWNQYWPEIQQLFEEVWNAMKPFVEVAIGIIKTYISAGLAFIKGAWQNGWNAIKDALKFVWDLIKGSIQTDWDLISGIVSVGLDVLTGHWGKAWDDVKSTFVKVWDDITGTFGNLLNDAANFGTHFVESIASGISGAIGSVTKAVSGVVSSVTSLFTGGGGSTPNVAKHASGGIFNSPHLGLVAEAGPEAIIPLSNPSRGLALWQQAGEMLGGFTSISPMSSSASSTGNSGGVVYNVNVYANGNITRNERELGDIVSKAILNKVKMQGKI